MSRLVWSDNGGGAIIHWSDEIQHLKNLRTVRETVPEKERTSIQHFEIRLLNLDIKELQCIIDEFLRIYNVYQKSLSKLSLLTNVGFQQNHQQIINHNNVIWNNIIFSLPIPTV
jgi:hypothetical protein